MVSWNSKERGVKIGASQGMRGLILGCEPCHRWIRVEMADAIARFGSQSYSRDLARRLKCEKCGQRKGYVMAWAMTADAERSRRKRD
jgi:hypothetical protein